MKAIIASALIAVFSVASAQERPPSTPVPKPVPGRVPGIPIPKPRPVIEAPAPKQIDFSPANRYADKGDSRVLDQATSHSDAGDAATLNSAFQHTADRISAIDKQVSAGIAQAAALAGSGSSLNLNLAHYGGQSAVGLVISHEIGRMNFNAGVSASEGGRTLTRVGFGWRF